MTNIKDVQSAKGIQKLEKRIDRYNHILELIRTIASLLAGTGGLLLILKFLGIIDF
tara:strand:- start:46566 stop:46733 length:168 start_codon:yes stop_codon:yes gene_type:complete